MPSCTRSHLSTKVPAADGNARFAWTCTLWPGCRSAPSFVRRPSHTTVAPAGVDQWYESGTGFALPTSHGKLLLLVKMIGTTVILPAIGELGRAEVYEGAY